MDDFNREMLKRQKRHFCKLSVDTVAMVGILAYTALIFWWFK